VNLTKQTQRAPDEATGKGDAEEDNEPDAAE
jgi:hypothetical protein